MEYAPSRSVAAEARAGSVAVEASAEVRRENPALVSMAFSVPSEGPAEEAPMESAATKAPSSIPQRGPEPASATFVPLRASLAGREAPVSIAAEMKVAIGATTKLRQGLAPALPGSFPSKAGHSEPDSQQAERPVGVDAPPEAERPAAVLEAAALISSAQVSVAPPSGPWSETERYC